MNSTNDAKHPKGREDQGGFASESLGERRSRRNRKKEGWQECQKSTESGKRKLDLKGRWPKVVLGYSFFERIEEVREL